MSNSNDDLLIKIRSDIDGYLKSLDKVVTETKNVGKVVDSETKKINVSWRDVFKGTLVADVIQQATRAMVNFSKQAVEMADKLDDLKERTGIQTDQLQRMNAVAIVNGTSLESVLLSVNKLDRGLANAANGNSKAAETFKNLGLSVSEMLALNPDERFQAVVTEIAKIPDVAERSRVAFSLFGRQSIELMGLINQGAEGIKEGMNNAYIASEENIAIVAQAADAWELFLTNVKAMFIDFVATAMKIGQGIFDAFATPINALTDSNIFGGFVDGAVSLFQTLVEALRRVASAIYEYVMQPIAKAQEAIYKVQEGYYKSKIDGGLSVFTSDEEKSKARYALDKTMGERFDLKQVMAENNPFEGSYWDKYLNKKTGETKSENKPQKSFSDFFSGKNNNMSDALQNKSGSKNAGDNWLKDKVSEANSIIDSNKTSIEKYNEEVAKLDELYKMGLLDQENYNRALKSANEELTMADKTMKSYSSTMGGGMADGLKKLADGTLSWKDALVSVGIQLTDVIFKQRQSTSGGFMGATGSFWKDLGNFGLNMAMVAGQSYLNGGGSSGAGASLPAVSAYAKGGSIRAGQTAIVGDGGEPELFTPSMNGTITPFSKMGGGVTNVVNQSINLSAGVPEAVRMELIRQMPAISRATQSAMVEAVSRGGNMAAMAGAR